jgi:GNAT superfamily N-acetyltransferase
MTAIWNDILEDGLAFPGEEFYSESGFEEFLKTQAAVTCMFADGKLAGYYKLLSNNIGRCSHIANAGYAVSKAFRGKGLGSPLVCRSVRQARELGFRGMQFNAVVAGNKAAIHIYQKNGFEIIGTVPGGFRLKSGEFSDMHIMYLVL